MQGQLSAPCSTYDAQKPPSQTGHFPRASSRRESPRSDWWKHITNVHSIDRRLVIQLVHQSYERSIKSLGQLATQPQLTRKPCFGTGLLDTGSHGRHVVSKELPVKHFQKTLITEHFFFFFFFNLKSTDTKTKQTEFYLKASSSFTHRQ